MTAEPGEDFWAADRQETPARLSSVDDVVLSLYGKSPALPATGGIATHFAEIYGRSLPEETITQITDNVIEEANECTARPRRETDSRSRCRTGIGLAVPGHL
jgi:hypothetical protein